VADAFPIVGGNNMENAGVAQHYQETNPWNAFQHGPLWDDVGFVADHLLIARYQNGGEILKLNLD
jgi:hypothetical protein